MQLISSHCPLDRRATAIGLYGAGGFSSNVVLSLLGPALIGPLGWRSLFMLFSVVAMITVSLYGRLGATTTRRGGGGPIRLDELAALMRQPVLWIAGTIQFVRLALVQGIRFGCRPSSSPIAASACRWPAWSSPSGPSGPSSPPRQHHGWLPLRPLQRSLLIISTSLSVPGITCLLLVRTHSLPLLLIVIVMQSVFIQMYFAPLFDVPLLFIGSQCAGSINGFSNLCANLGGLVSAYLLGVAKDVRGSFAIGFYTLAGLCAVGLLATWRLHQIRPDSVTDHVSPVAHRDATNG